MPVVAIAKLLVLEKLRPKPAVASAKLRTYTAQDWFIQLCNCGTNWLRKSLLVKTARAVFVFMSDLHSSSVNAFTAISRSRSITIQTNPSMSSIPNFMFCAVAVVYSFSAVARTTAAASTHRKSTLIELQEQTISEILQQTASLITEERL